MSRTLRILAILALAAGCGDDDGMMTDTTDTTDTTMPMDAGQMMDDDAGTMMDDDAGTMGGDFAFRTDAPEAYTRVDRMGVPAVSTALVTSANKNAYNDGDPTDDVSGDAPGRWAGEFIGVLDGLHAAVGTTSGLTVNEQIASVGLTPCADGATCATQEVAPGAPVYSFVIPDVLTIDTNADAGFPNGRRLQDPVMDIILALVLLDLDTHGPATFADLAGDGTASLNPPANDVAFMDDFPFVANPHTP